MPFTDVPGARLYWKREGRDEGPALLLLNSIGTDMGLWDMVVPKLRDRFAILRIDTRGHGASRAEPGDYSLALLASDVIAVADAAGFDRLAIAGVSLGGMIGMELALREPARVAKLALVCTSAAMDKAAWEARVATVRRDGMPAIAALAMGRFLSDQFRVAEPGISETLLRQLLAMDAEAYAGCGAAIRDMDLADRIGGITAPTVVVTGSRDSSTPFAGHGDLMLAHIAGAVHLDLEAAHLAPLEAPDELARSLIAFLDG